MCSPPGHPKRLDHLPWFSFTHPMNPGIQDTLRTLQNTNQSIANAENSEICFRRDLLIQTKLLPGKPRENCLTTEPTCQTCRPNELPSATCFQGALLPTVLSHLGVWRLLLPTSAANSTQERKGKQLHCNVVWGLQAVPAPPASPATQEQESPSTFSLAGKPSLRMSAANQAGLHQ